MKSIAEISEDIEDELEDACKYIDKALNYKESDPVTADMFYQLSMEEMGHMERLHKRVVDMITEYRKIHGDPPPEMQWRYDYLHKKHMEKSVKIKVKQMMYKEKG